MLHDLDLVSVQEVRSKVEKAYEAWQSYKGFSQERVDSIVEAVAAAGRANSRRLAELAVQETGYGNVEDKTAKNLLCSDLLPRSLRGLKTVGVIREIPELRITGIAEPVGVVAAILPTTNPTSTVLYKTIIALKAGNAIVLSPHPRAKACSCAAAAVVAEAALRAGAPDGLIQCIDNSTLEGTNALMRHPKTGVILSTGGAGIVKAAYSSGKPAFGVGPGNVPVYLDKSYDVCAAVAGIIQGKSFDFGTVCSSEQTLVADRSQRDAVLAAMHAGGAVVLNDSQKSAVEKTLFRGGATVRAECVGQSPQRIAELAGFQVPASARILAAEIGGVGKDHPLSAEKLSPVLALLFVDGFEAGLEACEKILRFGGLGHTSAIYSNDESRVRQFGLRMPSFRVLVNTPSPQGSVGITTGVQPAMTLGCGAMAGNITSDNIGPLHLINIKRIAWAIRTPDEAFAAGSTPAGESAIPRDAVVAAVERYLSSHGASTIATPGESTIRDTVAGVVDRLLVEKRAPEAASCGCSHSSVTREPATPQAPIVDFVCENDVLAAVAQGGKILIGPKTIVTPSARDLAARYDVLVLAQR
jgi:acyl-CoA reductase-like NAD-dependent aldehyde dehydrogenase